MVTVFEELRKENCSHPHVPATKQFGGQVKYQISSCFLYMAVNSIFSRHSENTFLNF